MNSEIISLWNGYFEKLNEGILGTSLQDLTLFQIVILIIVVLVIYSFLDS